MSLLFDAPVIESDLPKLFVPLGEWRSNPERACRKTRINFFCEDTDENEIRKAKARCALCPVKDPCLEWALKSEEEFGIWGGHTPRERRKMIRRAR